jgi:hypothetical protein
LEGSGVTIRDSNPALAQFRKSPLFLLIASMWVILACRLVIFTNDWSLSRHVKYVVYSDGSARAIPNEYFDDRLGIVRMSNVGGAVLMVLIAIIAHRALRHKWATLLVGVATGAFVVGGFVGPLQWKMGPDGAINQLTGSAGYALSASLDLLVGALLVVVVIWARSARTPKTDLDRVSDSGGRPN